MTKLLKVTALLLLSAVSAAAHSAVVTPWSGQPTMARVKTTGDIYQIISVTGAWVRVRDSFGIRDFTLMSSRPAAPADIFPADCSYTAVNNAHTSAATGTAWNIDGDVIHIPAGTCAWGTNTLSITKNVSFVGDGDSTFSNCSWTGSTELTHTAATMFSAGNASFRISGLKFTIASGSGNLILVNSSNSSGFRVDNNWYNSSLTSSEQLFVHAQGNPPSNSTGIPHPYGLIDNNIIDYGRVQVYGTNQNFSDGDGLHAIRLWADASPSYNEFLFVEDNCFTASATNVMDTNQAGRYIFRHNKTFGDVNVEVHSNQSSSTLGSHRWEIYNNVFTNNSSARFTAAFLRGGTGIMGSNTFSGTGGFTDRIALDNVRSFSSSAFDCNGARTQDDNTDPDGWVCNGQIGHESLVNLALDGVFTLRPASFFNNGGNPTVINNGSAVKTGGSSTDIQAGRDYFNATSGVIASRPAEPCTNDTDYYATDEDKLYRCSSNTWSLLWEPSTYPHPLQGSSTGPVLSCNAVSFVMLPTNIGSSTSTLAAGGTATVTCVNDGDSLLTFSSVAEDSTSFSVSHNCTTLAASASCAATITFTPLTPAATKTGTLTLASDDPSSPWTVALSGDALDPTAVKGQMRGTLVLQGGVRINP